MNRLKHVILTLALVFMACSRLVFAANIEHTVRKGDTLYHISKLYGVPLQVLLEVNNISNARSLKVGTKLVIPDTYRVKKGDTLYSIAHDNGILLNKLVSLNHIDANHIIKVGEVLVLPSNSSGNTSSVADSSSSSPASDGSSSQTVSMSTDTTPFWPATGTRVFLTGKLAGGTQISGSVGDPVYAVAPGKVVWAGPYRGYGRVVFVESGSGYIYVYGGNETNLVKVGDTVQPGTEVANMGINPHLGTACTYFFVYKNGRPVNPKTAPRG